VRKKFWALAALALIAAAVIAGCGGGGSSSSSGASGSSGGEAETASSTGGATGYGGGRYGGNEEEESAAASESEGEEEAMEETAAAATGGGAAVVKVTNTPDLGKVIVDSEGMTLYDFDKDKGTTSSCYGACAEAWPPLLTEGAPKAMGGAEASLLGVTKRKDGTEQVTYNGHPLYGFVEDQKPGETNGNDVSGFGAEWYALMPNGEEPADS
jgi:predicted lipoprotein with Yx(FWY)xxD motif